MNVRIESRAKGAIWGTCVIDALGGSCQFMDRGTFPLVREMMYINKFRKPAGSFSDDGSMTLALAQSIIDKEVYDHGTTVQYFLDWLDNGRFSSAERSWDVGGTTRLSLNYWKQGITDTSSNQLQITQETVRKVSSGVNNQGNGSLMRIAPIGVAYYRKPDLARRIAGVQSEVTHPMRSCIEACQIYTDLMIGVMLGESKEQLSERIQSFQFTNPDPQLANRIRKYKSVEDWKKTSAKTLKSSGFVIDTLECVLWGFFKYTNFSNGAVAVVNLAGDSDTVGAIYGALAGAYYGVECIPPWWTSKMQKYDLIEQVADEFAAKVASDSISNS
ncbi:ADP-ribosylation/Crystallin J1 [Penicillium herquei]|nr:ADP-ribosylation/Crystallin J1 [Penicillium herquei]